MLPVKTKKLPGRSVSCPCAGKVWYSINLYQSNKNGWEERGYVFSKRLRKAGPWRGPGNAEDGPESAGNSAPGGGKAPPGALAALAVYGSLVFALLEFPISGICLLLMGFSAPRLLGGFFVRTELKRL